MKDDIDCLKLAKLDFIICSCTLAKPNTILKCVDKKTTCMENKLNKISVNQHNRFDSNCMSSPVRPNLEFNC